MKLSSLIISLLLLGKFAFSQQYFNSTYITQGLVYPPTNIIPTDSGYIIGSSTANTIYLLDSSANEKWFKQYSLGLPGGFGNLMSDNIGNFIASGTLQGGIDEAYLIKFNNSFDTIYSKILITETICNGCLHMVYCFVDNNEKYILLGRNSRDSNGVSIPDADALFIKTDTSGNIINHKLIGSSNDADWFNTGLQMGNNYYLFGGTYSYAPGGIVGMDRMDGWVVKTDLQGNEISSAAFGNPNLFDYDFKFVTKHNNLLISAISSGTTKHSSGAIFLSPKILLIDQNLNINKEIKINESVLIGDTMYRSYINQIVTDYKNNFFVLMWDNKFNVNTYTNRNTTSVVKLDSLFNICYYRRYSHLGGQFNSENSTVISSTSDGGYIFGGYVNDNTLTPSQQSWLVKTDSLGCDGFHSCDDTLLVCNILQAPDTACKNDTAWLQVRFKGRSAPYFVYANTTLALDSVYYPYTLPLWIDTLIPYYPITTGMQNVIISVKDPWGWNRNDTVQVYVKNCGAGYIEENWYPKKVEIYPNPASTELRVRMRAGTGNKEYSITIYNMQGKVLKQITTKQSENIIDVSELEQGVYGVKVSGNKINVSERFVKL